jgi:hypothetical protein
MWDESKVGVWSSEGASVIAAKQERKGKGIDKDRGKSRTRKC